MKSPAVFGPLEPNAILRLEFPHLPPTFFAQETGNNVPAQFTAQLPSNYSKTGRFPLFVYLAGGTGGPADETAVQNLRDGIGEMDFITLALPLFRNRNVVKGAGFDAIPKEVLAEMPPRIIEMIEGQMTPFVVSANDYAAVGPAYTTMLEAFFDAVPNVDSARSIIVGMSNGAHTLGALLGKKDPFILEHFHSFVLAEGGDPMGVNGKHGLTPEFKNHRFLILWGEGSEKEMTNDPTLAALRPYAIKIVKDLVESAVARDLDFTLVMMRNTGHAFPSEYRALVKEWARTDGN